MSLRNLILFTSAAILLGASSCGVKGPPLPPIPDTPANSDRASPYGSPYSASPTPAASPAPSGS